MNRTDQVDDNHLPPRIMLRWRQHCPSFTMLKLHDRSVVYYQGDCCARVYHVAAGYLKRAAIDGQGHALIRSLLRGGDFFGVVSGQLQQTMHDTVVCKGPVELYRCRADEFSRLLDTRPGIARHLLANLSSQLEFAYRQSEAILYSSAEMRVAIMLRDLIGRQGGHCRHGHEIDIRLTQQELAELVGASRPVVSTILNDLRQRRIVSYTRTFICIDSMTALEQLLQ